jgi:hypothetical protein
MTESFQRLEINFYVLKNKIIILLLPKNACPFAETDKLPTLSLYIQYTRRLKA